MDASPLMNSYFLTSLTGFSPFQILSSQKNVGMQIYDLLIPLSGDLVEKLIVQEPTSGPYPELGRSTTHPSTLFL
jgi:hypothetical protein